LRFVVFSFSFFLYVVFTPYFYFVLYCRYRSFFLFFLEGEGKEGVVVRLVFFSLVSLLFFIVVCLPEANEMCRRKGPGEEHSLVHR